MSLYINPITQEPYVRLAPPLDNIIVTPNRGPHIPSDQKQVIEALNDPRIYEKLDSPPFPYLPEHAVAFQTGQVKECAELIEHWQRLPIWQRGRDRDSDGGEEDKGWVHGNPFRNIREVIEWSDSADSLVGREVAGSHGDDDASTLIKYPVKDVMIGDIGITNYAFYELPSGSEEKSNVIEAQKLLPPGSEKFIWGIGFWLLPRYHRRGIMSTVVKVLIHEWMVPNANAHVIKGVVHAGNEASAKVFEKNGFVREQTIDSNIYIPESGRESKPLHVYRWERT